MSDHSNEHVTLNWTLGEVQVRRFELDDERCLTIYSPDADMHEYGGETQAVCLEELDELIQTLVDQRVWLAGGPDEPTPHDWTVAAFGEGTDEPVVRVFAGLSRSEADFIAKQQIGMPEIETVGVQRESR